MVQRQQLEVQCWMPARATAELDIYRQLAGSDQPSLGSFGAAGTSASIRRKGKCSLKIKGSDSRRPVGGSGAKRFVRRRSHGQHQLAASGDLLVGNPASRDGFAVERGGLDAGIFAGIIFRDDRE